ncbi:MAG: hypothetical protein WDN28_31590 [Chthoniobacter sp.]
MSRFALCLALLCVGAQSARGLQLGETREQLLARHGAPGAEDHARNLAVYFWEGWSAARISGQYRLQAHLSPQLVSAGGGDHLAAGLEWRRHPLARDFRPEWPRPPVDARGLRLRHLRPRANR